MPTLPAARAAWNTPAFAAAVKKQEIEQGKQTMEQVRKNLEQVNRQAAQRAEPDK